MELTVKVNHWHVCHHMISNHHSQTEVVPSHVTRISEAKNFLPVKFNLSPYLKKKKKFKLSHKVVSWGPRSIEGPHNFLGHVAESQRYIQNAASRHSTLESPAIYYLFWFERQNKSVKFQNSALLNNKYFSAKINK